MCVRPRSLTAACAALGVALAAASALVLSACGSSSDSGDEATAVTIDDPWVKAADSGMTAAFGTLVNDSDSDVVVVSASSAPTSSMELHEMATNDSGDMIMRPKDGGFVIPAGGTHQLDPGSDHLMFMDVTDPIEPGEDVTVTLTFEDGSTMDFVAPARSFSGAEEEYEGGDMDMDMGLGATTAPEVVRG